MRAVTLLVNSILPEDLRDDNRIFDKRGIGDLLAQVAKRYPEKYAAIAQEMSDIGRKASYLQGETLTLKDMRPTFDKDARMATMDEEIEAARKISKSPAAFRDAKMEIWSKYAQQLEKETIDSSLASGSNLANTIVSGARGNPFQLKAMITGPNLYTDYKDKPVPLFVRRSFGEGLRPGDYLASAYGVRRSVISTKVSTAKGGDLSKQLSAATAHIIVTEDDCGTSNGLDLGIRDNDLIGRTLTRAYGDAPAGTVVDRQLVSEMAKKGVKTVIARSPVTCQAKTGICAQCLGQLADGKFATKGYAAGITASNSIGEPLTQSALNSKHTGGGFTGKKKVYSGFSVINQLVQSPEVFPNKATVSEIAGRVESIVDAPQGGKFITIAGVQHYTLPDHEPIVKPGDELEAGDTLNEGIVDVSDIVKHRGLGEGRRYYVDRLRQALDDSGISKPNRNNLEVIARGAIDHVRIDDPDGVGDYLPDDIISYSQFSTQYSPPLSTRTVKTEKANKQYLQVPVLHYTIGTQLTPKMTKHISDSGITDVSVSSDAPKFVPEMVRLRGTTQTNPDWFARLHSSYVGTNLDEAASRARDTDLEANTHFAPRLAVGKDFGKNVETTGKF